MSTPTASSRYVLCPVIPFKLGCAKSHTNRDRAQLVKRLISGCVEIGFVKYLLDYWQEKVLYI